MSIFLSILPSLLMSTSSFLQVSPVASHANQPYPHYTDFDSVETSDRLPHISAPIQPPQTNPPTTTSTNTRAKPPPQISTRRLPAPTTLTLTLSQHRHRHSTDAVTASARFVLLTGRMSGRPHSSNLTGHTLTGRVPDRPGIRQDTDQVPNQTKPNQIRPDQTGPNQVRLLAPPSPRPAGRSPQIFPPNLTAD